VGRSGYIDNLDCQWQFICWRGAVTSAIRGKRGQAFLKEMLAALDALPEKKLIKDALQDQPARGAVCALGALGRCRGLDMGAVDEYDHETIAGFFGIPHALACEIMYINDEHWWRLSAEERWVRVRQWIVSCIRVDNPNIEIDRWSDDGGASNAG